jgi:hypothetical protein
VVVVVVVAAVAVVLQLRNDLGLPSFRRHGNRVTLCGIAVPTATLVHCRVKVIATILHCAFRYVLIVARLSRIVVVIFASKAGTYPAERPTSGYRI